MWGTKIAPLRCPLSVLFATDDSFFDLDRVFKVSHPWAALAKIIYLYYQKHVNHCFCNCRLVAILGVQSLTILISNLYTALTRCNTTEDNVTNSQAQITTALYHHVFLTEIIFFLDTCQLLKFPLNELRAQSRVRPVVGLLTLASGSACDARRITAAEMKYMRRTARYTGTHYKTNAQIAKELKITPNLDKLVE